MVAMQLGGPDGRKITAVALNMDDISQILIGRSVTIKGDKLGMPGCTMDIGMGGIDDVHTMEVFAKKFGIDLTSEIDAARKGMDVIARGEINLPHSRMAHHEDHRNPQSH